MTPFPVILSAPSGAGKTTIARSLLERRDDLGYSVSCTTRSPRDGEVDGIDYHFLSVDEFVERRRLGEFAESAEVHGRYYGTLRTEVDRVLASGRHCVMDIDVQGARQFAQSYPESVLIFVLPPSGEVLVQRLRGRNSEEPDRLRLRLENARDEIREVGQYQFVVVNDDLHEALDRVSSIIDTEEVRHDRIKSLESDVGALIAQLDREINAIQRGG